MLANHENKQIIILMPFLRMIINFITIVENITDKKNTTPPYIAFCTQPFYNNFDR